MEKVIALTKWSTTIVILSKYFLNFSLKNATKLLNLHQYPKNFQHNIY